MNKVMPILPRLMIMSIIAMIMAAGVFAGQKSGGALEITSDVVGVAGTSIMTNGNIVYDSVVGQPGGASVFFYDDQELFAGFLSTLGDAPILEVVSINQRTDGTGNVDISVRCSDTDEDFCKIKVLRSGDGAIYNSATILGSSASATVGTWPSITSDPYQIGTDTPIITTSSNVISFVWDSKTDLPSADGTVYLKFALNDQYLETNITSGTLVDNASPVVFNLSFSGFKTATSVTLTTATAAVDSHFSEYKIFYSSTAPVTEASLEWSSSTNTALADRYFDGVSSIIITSLLDNTSYYFKLWSYDTFGNKGASPGTVGPIFTTSLPIVTNLTRTIATDGTGRVTIGVDIVDGDEDICKLKVQYSLTNGSDPWYTAYISSVTTTKGTAVLDSSATYQLTNLTTQDVDPNRITVVWDTQHADNESGVITESEIVKVRVIAYSPTPPADGVPAVSDVFTLDNNAPTGPSDLQTVGETVTGTSVKLTWTQAAEVRFDKYEIWYATFTPVIREGVDAGSWSAVEDSRLSSISTTSTVVRGLEQGKHYYFKLWGVDTYGNMTATLEADVVMQWKPIVSFGGPAPVQNTTGDGGVDIFALDFVDLDETSLLRLKVEYSTNTQSCPWQKATLKQGSVSSSHGPALTVNNTQEYQIENIIVYSTMGNTLNMVWDSKQDIPALHTTNASLRFTVNDGTNTCDDPEVSSSFEVDNTAPVHALSGYTHTTQKLEIYFNEVISSATIIVALGAGITIKNDTNTETFDIIEPLTIQGTLGTDATGFICVLSTEHRDVISDWQSLGVSNIQVVLKEGVVKDIKGNNNAALPATNMTWNQDIGYPQLLSAEYKFEQFKNVVSSERIKGKLTLEFSEKMNIETITPATLLGIRLQEDQTGVSSRYVNLSASDTIVTTEDGSEVVINLSTPTVKEIAGWPYNTEVPPKKYLYVAINPTVIKDISGNAVTAKQVSSALPFLSYDYDEEAPDDVAFEPEEGSFYVDPAKIDKIKIIFDEPMYTGNMSSIFSMHAVRDNLGKVIDVVADGTFLYSDEKNEFIFTPTYPLAYNHTYKITVNSTVQDITRNKLGISQTAQFKTILDASDENIVVVDTNKEIDIPAGFLPENGYLDVNTAPVSSLIETANRKKTTESSFNQILADSLIEIIPRKVDGVDMTPRLLAKIQRAEKSADAVPTGFMTIKLPYKDTDDDGFVDSMPNVARVSTLRLYWLDEEHSLWVRLPSVSVDTGNKVVYGKTKLFGVFALFAEEDTDVSKAYAFPVPFKPSEGHTKITFTNLSAICTIKIYTIAGELVRTIVHNSGYPQYEWDVTSDAGNSVFSGVYIYYIKSKTDSKEGKLMIIR